MTAWARLTWQVAEPSSMADVLASRLGAPQAGIEGLVPRARVLHLGSAVLEVRPWVREGPADDPLPAGRLVLEPVPGGEEVPRDPRAPGAEGARAGLEPPDIAAGDRGPGGRPPVVIDPSRLVLVGIAWATVDLERAEAELDMWLDPPPAIEAPADRDPDLGARLRLRGAAGLPGDWLVLAEPSTEGRAAASLARDGEGPCGLYLAPAGGLDAWLGWAAGHGVALRSPAPEPGPFGRQVLLAGSPAAGPHLLVAAGRTPVSAAPGTSTIGA